MRRIDVEIEFSVPHPWDVVCEFFHHFRFYTRWKRGREFERLWAENSGRVEAFGVDLGCKDGMKKYVMRHGFER